MNEFEKARQLTEGFITTPETIELYKAAGIPCDQATVSCLARQGRFNGKKIAGAWIFLRASVQADIRLLKIIRRRTNAN